MPAHMYWYVLYRYRDLHEYCKCARCWLVQVEHERSVTISTFQCFKWALSLFLHHHCKMPQTSGPRSSPGRFLQQSSLWATSICYYHKVKGRGYMGRGRGLHHCPSTGQGCRRTPGDHCHTGARCATLHTTNRQEERDTPPVNNNMFTGYKQTQQEGVRSDRQRRLTDLLVSHRSPQVRILIWNKTQSVIQKCTGARACHDTVPLLSQCSIRYDQS